MNKNNPNLTLSSYLNSIAMYFYEDAGYMESVGKNFGFDVNKNCFLAMSFLYPSDMSVSLEEKTGLMKLLSPLSAYGPINSTIDSPQLLMCDHGTVLFLIAQTREELSAVSSSVCEKAPALLNEQYPDVFIRIGIGTIEHGLTGIANSYDNSLKAVNAGEKFKKERRILDYIKMELYCAINAMVLGYGESLTRTILQQLTEEEQTILGKYYKCKEQIPSVSDALQLSEDTVIHALQKVKEKTGLDVNDTEDNFKLNFVMIAKRVLDKEKQRYRN